MRYLLLVALIGCGVKPDNKIKELQDKVKQSQVQSDSVQVIASEDNKKVITKTVETIVTLKEEVKELKTELNEVKAKLDSANSVDTNSTKFKLREARIDSLLRANIKTRDSLRIDLLTLKDTLTQRNKLAIDTLNDYRNRYYKNIAIYEKYEKAVDFEIKLHRLNSVLFAMLTLFLYSQIN